MSSFFRLARRSALSPALAAAALVSSSSDRLSSPNCQQISAHTHCEAAPPNKRTESSDSSVRAVNQVPVKLAVELSFDGKKDKQPKASLPRKKVGFQPDAKGYFYDTLPNSQVFQPKFDWPMWDTNWDEREPTPSGDKQVDRRKKRYLRKNGVTRHIILVRHGQYHETHKASYIYARRE